METCLIMAFIIAYFVMRVKENRDAKNKRPRNYEEYYDEYEEYEDEYFRDIFHDI